MDLTGLLEELLDDLHAQTRGAELLAPLDHEPGTAAAVIRFKLNLAGALVADGWSPPTDVEQELVTDRCLLAEPDDSGGTSVVTSGDRPRPEIAPNDDARALAEQADLLRAALAHRAVIDIAKGLVMGRYDLAEGRAWDHLVRLSQSQNVKLRDVATRMLAEHEDRGSSAPPRRIRAAARAS